MLRTDQDLDNQLSVLETETEMAQAKAKAQINQAKATQEFKKSYDEITKSYKSQLQEFCSSKTASITLENFSKEINNAYVCFDPTNISDNILDSSNDPKDDSKKACQNPNHILLDCFGSAVGLNKNDVIKQIAGNTSEIADQVNVYTSGKLSPGFYKVIVEGAGGGGGGADCRDGAGGNGGDGAKVEEVFYLATAKNYTSSIGKGGAKGTGSVNVSSDSDNAAKDGGASTFKIEGVIDITAEGGKGGRGGVRGTAGKRDGADGANGGNGEGGSGGSGGDPDEGFCISGRNYKRDGENGSDGSISLFRKSL